MIVSTDILIFNDWRQRQGAELQLQSMNYKG